MMVKQKNFRTFVKKRPVVGKPKIRFDRLARITKRN
jgi:hypothetical protein